MFAKTGLPKYDEVLLRLALAQVIRSRRKQKGWQQKKLARKTSLPPSVIAEIEQGTKMPTLKIIVAIAQAFRTSAFELVQSAEGLYESWLSYPLHMKQLWAPWRMDYVSSGEEISECIFCDALSGKIQAHIVETVEFTFTMLNKFPYNSGHLMVVPHHHVSDITELNSEEAAALMTGTQRAVQALRHALAPEGLNIGINQGKAAGGSLDHIHLHVVPRWGGDTNFMPVLADTKVLPDHLDATAEKLRQAYSAL
jgi:ATP adenylyltransferase